MNKLKLYKLIRTVKEEYQIYAHNKKEALASETEDPSVVVVKSERVVFLGYAPNAGTAGKREVKE